MENGFKCYWIKKQLEPSRFHSSIIFPFPGIYFCVCLLSEI